MKTLATGLLVLSSVLVAQSSIAQQSINAPPDAIFYNGKVIGFCCPDCVDEFKKDPEKYMKTIK